MEDREAASAARPEGPRRALEREACEEELHHLLASTDSAAWVAVYRVIQRVADEELWRPDYRSFSAWLRETAQREHVAESLLWQRKKAGDFFERWRSKAGDGAPTLEQSGVSAANLAEVDRLTAGDVDKADAWVRGLASGRLSQRDVRAARTMQKSHGGKVPRNGYEREKMMGGRPDVPDPGDAAKTAEVLAALQAEVRTWVWGDETDEERERRERATAGRRFLARDNAVAQVLTEFPVRVETAERARRIDALAVDPETYGSVVVENETEADWMRVTLRGVEVKVSEADLRRDCKMGDYAMFVDYFYLAVPDELVPVAEEVSDPAAGLLAYSGEREEGRRVATVREPERLDAPRREDALMTALVKVLSRKI